MRSSVVTCTYNRSEQLFRGMMSILNQEVLPGEIVIVDDGSKDNTSNIVDQIILVAQPKGVNIKYVYVDFPAPRISCIPRNIGIKEASGQIIIFTEPEAIHVGNTIGQILTKLDQNPNSIPMATQVWSMGQSIYHKLTEDNWNRPITIIQHPYADLVSGDMKNMKAPDSDWAITGSLNCFVGILFAAFKQDLLDIGGFDESFEGHGWDDWDLLHRLERYGRPTLQCNDIPVIHAWHEKNYPYNIYDAAEKNGKASERRAKKGEFRANIDKDWGKME